MVSTARSALPLDRGKWGLLVEYVKPRSFAKRVNSADAYSGPLSLLTSSGIPCLAKIALRALITSCDFVAFFMAATSIQREK